MIVATFWRHHMAHIGTCAIWWWWLASVSWAPCWITRRNNAIASWVTRHRKAWLTRRRHHFTRHIMGSASCIGETLPHVTHGIHYGSRHVHTVGHHHGASILHYGAHFRATCISGAHVTTTTNSCTESVARGIKRLW